MSILLTGGAGYIGSNCYYALQELKEEIIVVDDLSTGHRHLLPSNVIFYKVNVANVNAISEIIRKHNIKTVFHFAGSIVVAESTQDPNKYYQNNTMASLALLQACIKEDVQNFIFSSTATVYENNEAGIYHEQSKLKPKSPYAKSKLMTEMMLQDFHKAYGINIIILRYFNVAGANLNNTSGQISKKSTHLIKVASEVVTGKREFLPIYGEDYNTPDGTCIRDYIHISDLADAHIKAYEYLCNQKTPILEHFNCGYGRGFSVKDVINAINKIIKKPIPIRNCKRRNGDPEILVADPNKLIKLTNWQPKYNDLNVIIKTAINWEASLPIAMNCQQQLKIDPFE